MNVVYVTGNENKARLFNEMIGIKLEHVSADVDEIQSLDIREVVGHKAKEAYRLLKHPVVVEDTQLVFTAFGALPGPLIKWFLQELGTEGVCRLLDGKDRSAIAGAAIAYYDGETLEVFEKEMSGQIALNPGKGTVGFGWDSIFIPEGQTGVTSDMDEKTYKKFYKMTKPFEEIAKFLKTI